MDLNMIKNKLEGLNPQAKKSKGEKTDYSKIYWKPKTEGKHQIRVVPSKHNPEWPFFEVKLHYGMSKFPIYALSNWGEKDPVEDFVKELRKTNESENWRLAKQLEPKMRYFCQVVARGEEDKGVRLFEFGKLVYQQLLNIADDEDYGDFTDLKNGFDFTVTTEKDEFKGREYLKITSIQPKRKESPLSDDADQVKEWLEKQYNILDLQAQYKKDYDSLKEVLQNYISPEDEEDEIISETPSGFDDDETAEPKSNYSLSTKKDTKKKVEKFDEMFDGDDDDDLPF